MTDSWTVVDDWPKLARVRQSFPGTPLADPAAAAVEALRELVAAERIRPGSKIAVTAGSRGVRNIVEVTAALVAELRRLGAEPFALPCMGSHGGATPEGQLAVLAGYGITPEAVGAPVLSQPNVVQVGQSASGIPLWVDQLAAEADGILVVNRVKCHTDFTGIIESGPTKMLAIGIGKHHSAGTLHQNFVERGYAAVIREVGDALWTRLPLLGGIGLVENGHDETVRIGAVRPASHESDEAALLAYSKEVFGKLPFAMLHMLIVDEIGKEISGAGMDPNVTGADTAKIHDRRTEPFCWRVLVRGLSAGTHGNATGIGHADFTLQRCVDAIDWHATATNVVTAASPEAGRCPLTFPNDLTMLRAAFQTTGTTPPAQQRVVRLRNTLLVDDFLASEALLPEVRDHPRCEVVGPLEPMRFDARGLLADVPTGH